MACRKKRVGSAIEGNQGIGREKFRNVPGYNLRLKRLVWSMVQATLYRFSFHTWSGWRAALLRDEDYQRVPELVEALHGKGLALENLGRFTDAAACYQQLVDQEPRDLVRRCGDSQHRSVSSECAIAGRRDEHQ